MKALQKIALSGWIVLLTLSPTAVQGQEKKQGEKKDEPKKADDDKDAIQNVFASYIKADGQERYKFVRDGEKLKPEMEKYYAQRPVSKPEITTISTGMTKINDHAYATVSTLEGKSNGKAFNIAINAYVCKEKGAWVVDWHATTGKNSIRLKTFRAVKPTAETVLRITAEISDYYNYHYSNAKRTHWSMRIQENKFLPAADVIPINGYVAKDTALGKELFALLEDGQPHDITVGVRTNGREGNAVEITKLVSKTWYID